MSIFKYFLTKGIFSRRVLFALVSLLVMMTSMTMIVYLTEKGIWVEGYSYQYMVLGTSLFFFMISVIYYFMVIMGYPKDSA